MRCGWLRLRATGNVLTVWLGALVHMVCGEVLLIHSGEQNPKLGAVDPEPLA